MQTQAKVWAISPGRHHAFLFFPFFATLILFASGCATVKNMLVKEEPVQTQEIVIQSSPSYGVVTQVTSAAMKDKEIRLGDIAITVDIDDGPVIVVIQPEDDIYKTGDRVRIVRDGQGLVRAQIL